MSQYIHICNIPLVLNELDISNTLEPIVNGHEGRLQLQAYYKYTQYTVTLKSSWFSVFLQISMFGHFQIKSVIFFV